MTFWLEMGPVFHQFKPLQSPMLATAAPVLAPRCPPIDRNCDNGLTSRFTKAQEIFAYFGPIPCRRRSRQDWPPGSAIARRLQALWARLWLGDRRTLQPAWGARRGAPRCPGWVEGGSRVGRGRSSRAGREGTIPARLEGAGWRRWLPHRSYDVGSSSTNRRGNHRFQSWLRRVGMLRSVSPSNEC